MKEETVAFFNRKENPFEGFTLQRPKYVGAWVLGDIKFQITKLPSRKMRFMMKLFFDWGFEKY